MHPLLLELTPAMPAPLYLLTGPTAVGKSALALAWAQAHQAEILSCDALQVYRGLDIGTAKPSAVERALVPHHGLDLSDPAQSYSVAAYSEYAVQAVAEIQSRDKNILIVGGSGFYLKSFFAAIADDVDITPEIEAEVRALESQGLPFLIERLHAASPAGTGSVDLRNPRRVARALARCLASGKSVPQLAAEFAEKKSPFDAFDKKLVRLERSPAELEQRIHARTQKMFRDGLIDEVRRHATALRANPAGTAIGYRETLAWMDGGEKTSLADLAAEISLHTRQLVRKQHTWFRTQLPEHRVIELTEESRFNAADLFL
jgi:tRNA dimethylallyltransferase